MESAFPQIARCALGQQAQQPAVGAALMPRGAGEGMRMADMKPCRHLDYREGRYDDCEIRTCAPHYPEVRYWLRGERWQSPPGDHPPNPLKVQFCILKGRINGVFGCYNGEMYCYEPEEVA